MKFSIRRLTVSCKKAQEMLPFTDFNYFYGQVGAGKSTIARLIDFCLGGKLEYTLALQQEFVAATLEVDINGNNLLLTRNSQENQIRAQWRQNGQPFEALLPANQTAGGNYSGSAIEVPSDLLLLLAGVRPPQAAGGALADQFPSEISFGDLYSFCYLDQESMDSSFFDLESRQRNRDVMRLLIGWRHEQALDLEAELKSVRAERRRTEHQVRILHDALQSQHLPTTKEITAERTSIQERLQTLEVQLGEARAGVASQRPRGIENLQNEARSMAIKLGEIDDLLSGLQETIRKDLAHRNSLLALIDRQKRAESARAILGMVEFVQCPRCDRSLPPPEDGICPVCRQSHEIAPASTIEEGAVESDIMTRVEELEERTKLQTEEADRLEHLRKGISRDKNRIDLELNRALQLYDSMYLSAALEMEKECVRLAQRLEDLEQPESLAKEVEQQQEVLASLTGQEAELRTKQKAARAEVERYTENLDLLKKFFLECLVQSRLSGFREDDRVEISGPKFLPQVYGKDTDNCTSFANLGSGGKKCFFKACFAVALHRLACRTGAIWPTVLIIDSPMKNTSERENADQFAGFHQMLYNLKETELRTTQVIIIDKEYFAPTAKITFEIAKRHMTPDDPQNPPLIRYYQGK